MFHLGEELDHVSEHPAPGVQLGVELQQPGGQNSLLVAGDEFLSP